MSSSLHPMLNIAIKAARAAGAIINRGSQDLDLLTISHKGPNDLVSEVDRAAEAAIIDTLLAAYPGHGILAEESGRERGAKHSEFLWIIDPLDGTTNFLHGLPMYAVSIALTVRGKVEQAVVYDPTRNDLFYASRGRGAYLNDRRLRVSRRTRLADALVGTGFPFRRGDNLQRYLQMFETVLQNCAGLRRPGAAALDLCYVAAGWYDGFFETGLSPWDMAAGALMVTEAGGLIGNFTGEADFLFQREVVAGNPKVYGQLVSLLSPYSRAIRADDGAADAQPAVDAHSTVLAAWGAGMASSGAATGATPRRATAPNAAPAAGDAAGPADAAAAPAAAPVRERKPVRIRRLGAAPSGEETGQAETQVDAGGDTAAGDPQATPARPADTPPAPARPPERSDRRPPAAKHPRERSEAPPTGRTRPAPPRPDPYGAPRRDRPPLGSGPRGPAGKSASGGPAGGGYGRRDAQGTGGGGGGGGAGGGVRRNTGPRTGPGTGAGPRGPRPPTKTPRGGKR